MAKQSSRGAVLFLSVSARFFMVRNRRWVSGGQDPAGSVADGVAWSPSSIQPVDDVEPIRHSECSEKHEGARGEGDEATRSDFDATKGVFASRGGAGSRPQASCETRAVLDTLGEDDETYPTIKAALQKTEVQAQERPISEQTRITKMFISRKQKKVEQTRLETEKTKEVLSRAQTEQVEQEALSADGERMLEALHAKEKVLPPFTIPQPSITPNVQAEFSRLQGIIDSVQQELAHLRCGERLSHTLPDDDATTGWQIFLTRKPRWDHRAQIVGSTGHTTQHQCDCDEPPKHGSIWITRRQSRGSEPSWATKIVVTTARHLSAIQRWLLFRWTHTGISSPQFLSSMMGTQKAWQRFPSGGGGDTVSSSRVEQERGQPFGNLMKWSSKQSSSPERA